MEEKVKPAKKTQYVDEMKRLVIGTEPKPPQNSHVEYDPMYGFNVRRAPELQLGRKYAKELENYGESDAMLYGGTKKKDEKYEPEWGYD